MFRMRAVGWMLSTVPAVLAACSGFTESHECDPGESSSCEAACGPGTTHCLPGGTWDVCQPDRDPECLPGDYDSCALEEGAPPGLWFCSDNCEPGPCLDLCMPGETFECEAECGPGQRRCQDDGTWGECLEYVIPECRLGDVERCSGGDGHRRCSEDCYWGPCEDGPCTSGEVSECGVCASQVCLTDGTWTECTADPSSTCSPDEVEDCEAPCGPGRRTCSDRCEWSECLEIATVACHPGDRQLCPTTLYCGIAFRVCNQSCVWTDCLETGD